MAAKKKDNSIWSCCALDKQGKILAGKEQSTFQLGLDIKWAFMIRYKWSKNHNKVVLTQPLLQLHSNVDKYRKKYEKERAGNKPDKNIFADPRKDAQNPKW